MLERYLPSTPPPLLCIVAKKSWGISQRSLNQNLNTRHLVNTLGETEIGSRSADISTVMDIHGIHVSPPSLSVSLFLSLSLLAFYHKVLCTFGYPIGIPNYFAWHCNRGRSPVVSHLRLDSSEFGVH